MPGPRVRAPQGVRGGALLDNVLVGARVLEVDVLERHDRLAERADAVGLARIGEDERPDQAGRDHLVHLCQRRRHLRAARVLLHTWHAHARQAIRAAAVHIAQEHPRPRVRREQARTAVESFSIDSLSSDSVPPFALEHLPEVADASDGVLPPLSDIAPLGWPSARGRPAAISGLSRWKPLKVVG